jgi:hypothetical protein
MNRSDRLEDLGADRNITLRTDLREIRREFVGWIHLIQGRDQWRALVNTVVNLRVS